MAISRLCSVPDCGKPVCNGRGWCSAHYSRWRRHGSTDVVRKPANGDVRRYLADKVIPYEGAECLIWPFARDQSGYPRINGHKSSVASRAICEMIHGQPPTPAHCSAHSCGNGHLGCVNPTHLRWATSAENKADELNHGTRNRGDRNGMARLTANDVRGIRDLLGTMSQLEIAKLYGVHQVQISKIKAREVWGWLD